MSYDENRRQHLTIKRCSKKIQPRLQAFKNKFKVLINLIKIFTNCGTHDILGLILFCIENLIKCLVCQVPHLMIVSSIDKVELF